MGCGVKKVRCLLKELDDRKGIGLITRVRQGLGNPDRIYVKKCVSPERLKGNFQTGQNGLSGKAQMPDTDRCKLPGNDIEDSNTENNDTEYLSIPMSVKWKGKKLKGMLISRLFLNTLDMTTS